jgi:peptide/nickel transport system substrate-binding protein
VLRQPRHFYAVAIVLTVGVCAPGCDRARKAADVPVTLRIGLGAPPKGTRGTGLSNVVSVVSTENWLTNLPDGRTSDKVASASSWDESRTTLHLTLRKDVFFHDGTRLTPELAVLALKQSISEPQAPSSFASVKSVTASGADGVDIRLSEPNSFLLPDLAYTAVTLPGKPQIGTGPFKVTQSDAQALTGAVGQDTVALQAFDRYYRGHPTISNITITNYPTLRNAWAALMRDETDMLYEVGRDAVDFVQAESKVKTYSFGRPYYNALVFNVRHQILKRTEIRRALNEAVDRTALIRDGMNGRGRPADAPLLPEHWAYSTSARPFEFNPTDARQLLDQARLPIKPSTGGRMPSRFSFTCLVWNDPRFERLAVLIQKQLADVGVEMRLLSLPLNQLGERVAKGDFDAFLMEFGGRSLRWVYEFWHSHGPGQGQFDGGYRSADAVLDRIKAAPTDEEIRQGVTELIKIIREDPPAAFLAWQMTSRAVSTKFDVAFEADREIFGNLWKWRHVAPQQAAR